MIAADIGRKGCDSVFTVIKVTPQGQNPSIKSLVNISTMTDAHFEDQAIALKKLYYKYNARKVVIDGNGLGIGLVDYMVKTQIDPSTGETLFDFGVENDEDGFYKKYRTENTVLDGMYLVKANAPINTEAYAYLQTQLSTGKLKFLIPERIAKEKLLNTKMGVNMTPEERKIYLLPYSLTTILKDELMNLREENEGVNILLKRANKGIGKDKFSSFLYGLYYIKQEEDRRRKKKKFNASDWKFYSSAR